MIPVAFVTVLLIYALMEWLGGVSEVKGALGDAHWGWLALGLGLVVANLAVVTQRFRTVAEAMEYELGFRQCLEAILAAWPLGLLIPSRGGDFFRALVLRDDFPPWKCSGAIVAERIVDLQNLCLFVATGCVLMGRWSWALILLGAWAAGWGAVWAGVRMSQSVIEMEALASIRPKLQAAMEAFRALSQRPRALTFLMMISAAAWLNMMLLMAALFMAFGLEVMWPVLFAYWPLALVVGMLPITVGGVGTRDAAFVGIVAASHPSLVGPALLAATLSYGVLTLLIPALLGLPLLIRHLFRL